MGIAALWGVLTGCRPAPVSLGPLPAPAPEHPGGLRYYLAKDLAIVEADVTEYIETRIESDGGGILAERTETGRSAAEIKVSLRTTADPEFVYILNPAPRRLKDQALAVRVGDNGLLTSVELETKDRSGEILVQIARIAGQIAGAAAGFRGPEGFDPSAVARLLPDPDSSPAVLQRRERRLEALPLEALYFLQESAAGRDAWATVERLEDELEERRSALREQTDAAAGAREAAGFNLAEKRAGFVEETIVFLEKQAAAARSAFESAHKRFAAERRIGRETRRRKIRRHLEITDLPPSAVVSGAGGEDRIIEVLKEDFPRAFELYQEAGIVASFDPAVAVGPESGKRREDPGSLRKGKDELRIFYREPVPGFLRIFAWTEEVRPEEKCFAAVFRPVEETLIFAVHPGWPVRSIACDRRIFSSQSLKLAVNNQGRVVGIARTATSAGDGIFSGWAEALSAVRGEIEETLKDFEDVIQAWRGLSREKLEAQIDLLKLQMEKMKKDLEGG